MILLHLMVFALSQAYAYDLESLCRNQNLKSVVSLCDSLGKWRGELAAGGGSSDALFNEPKRNRATYVRFGRDVSRQEQSHSATDSQKQSHAARSQDEGYLRFGRSTDSRIHHVEKRESEKPDEHIPSPVTDPDDTSEAVKRYIRFGKRYMRFGRSGDNEDLEKRYIRFGKKSTGLDKRYIRFGKRSDEEDDASPTEGDDDEDVDKRYIRFGKRYMRFGKRNDFLRFGEPAEKRYIRFGKRNDFLRFGEPTEKRYIRFGKRNDFLRFGEPAEKRYMRFGKRNDFLRFGEPAEKRYIRFGRSDAGDEDMDENKRYIRFGRSGEADKRYIRFGKRNDFLRFGNEKRYTRFGRSDGGAAEEQAKEEDTKRYTRFGKRAADENEKINDEDKNAIPAESKVAKKRSVRSAKEPSSVEADEELARLARYLKNEHAMGDAIGGYIRFGREEDEDFGGDDDAEDDDEVAGDYPIAADKRYIRFGKRYIRFGRSNGGLANDKHFTRTAKNVVGYTRFGRAGSGTGYIRFG